MARFALLVAVLIAAASAAAGDKPPDPHFQSARTSAMVHKSVFIHGYLHGYEEGFHFADLDIQMGRSARDIRKCKEARDANGYRNEFGDKGLFEAGYRQGLIVGYADGMAGRAFRALSELQAIAALVSEEAAPNPDPTFDSAFSQGYSSGQHQGVQDGRREASYTSPAVPCPGPPNGGDPQTFCAAYLGGYRLGYSDGFTNVAHPLIAAEVARGAGK